MIKFTIPGEPVAQARPRVTRWGVYDPPKSKAYKELVALYARQAMGGKEPMEGALSITAFFMVPIPKSWSKNKRQKALMGEIQPTSKPDWDNYYKCLTDGMNGIVYNDDSQLVDISGAKRYSDEPRTLITVKKMEDAE